MFAARLFLTVGLLGCLGVLTGCGIDPNAKFFPAVLRAPDPKPAEADPPPDVRGILKSDLATVFLPSANPRNIRFSQPKPALGEWTSCVQANINGAMGNAIGRHTYLVNIARGKVSRQEHVGADHWCNAEAYEAM